MDDDGFTQIGIELTDVAMRIGVDKVRENLARALHELMCMDDHEDPEVTSYDPAPGALTHYQRHADTIINHALSRAAEVGIIVG